MENNGISFDGEKKEIDTLAAAIKHLPHGETDLLRLVLGDGMPLGMLSERGDGPFQTNEPTAGSGW